MIKLIIITCFLSFLLAKFSFGQENELTNFQENYLVYHTYDINYKNKKENLHVFKLLSNKEEAIDTFIVSLDKNINLNQTSYSDNAIHYCFSHSKKRNINWIISIEMPSKKIIKNIVEKSPMINSYFLGDYIYPNLYSNKSVIDVINWRTGKIYNLNLNINNNSKFIITDCDISKSENRIYYSVYDDRINKIIAIDNYFEISELIIFEENNNQIIDFSISDFGNENYKIITGTFSGNYKLKSSSVFLYKIMDKKVIINKDYCFKNLKGFYMYVDEKIRKEIRKLDTTKNDYIEYNVAVHKIIKNRTGYYLILDAYSPEKYSSGGAYMGSSYSGIGGSFQETWGGPSYYSSGFDGNKYTHVTILCLDNQLNMIWNYTFQAYSKGGREEFKGQRLTRHELKDDDSLLLFLPNEVVPKEIDKLGVLIEK